MGKPANKSPSSGNKNTKSRPIPTPSPPPPPPVTPPPPPNKGSAYPLAVAVTPPPSPPRLSSGKKLASRHTCSSPFLKGDGNTTSISEVKVTEFRNWRTSAASSAAGSKNDNLIAKPRLVTRMNSAGVADSPKAKKRISFTRSFSFGDRRPSSGNEALKNLFGVSFAEGVTVREFDRVDEELKNDIWYFAKELKRLLQRELEMNRKYEEGEMEEFDFADCCINSEDDEPPDVMDFFSWRGLEHIREGEERSKRIRGVTRGIVQWYQEAKHMEYEDPEELRLISKSRTKSDRTRAQKKASLDASFVKDMQKGDSSGRDGKGKSKQHRRRSSLSPQRMVRRISKNWAEMPKLNWSPKPNRKAEAIASA